MESAQATGALPAAGEVDIKIERPKLAEHGDFSTSLPLALVRTMRVPPIQIAAAIVDAMPQHEMFGKCCQCSPGFCQLYIVHALAAVPGEYRAKP
ncbi:MAG: hypothetical protein Ct9H300mP19_19750 [Dehalococcoidia bacterium]|nr:MAG: hypothetical protein Ct9H300mP19_19750 [Dehalococcoidia bacterium]